MKVRKALCGTAALSAVLFLSAGAPQEKDKEKRAAGAALLIQLTKAAESYELDHAVYPTSGNANLVKALRTKEGKARPYFEFAKDQLNEKGEVLDPWGRPLVYVNNTDRSAPKEWTPVRKSSFDLYSFGPDGKDDKGKGDDLTNW